MTKSEQLAHFEQLAQAARPTSDDDWGSERQIGAENVLWTVAGVIGVELEDFETSKMTTDEMIDEALRRARAKLA